MSKKFDDVIQKDLQLMWSIQEYCHENIWIHENLAKIVSKNPLKDVVIIIWIFFIFGVIEVGISHFWVVMINLVVVYGNSNIFNKIVEMHFIHAIFHSSNPKTDRSETSCRIR